MHEESVEFFSEGTRVRGIVRTADSADPGPRPAIVQGPGWLGLKDAKLYVRYHEALTAAGFAVLIFDYRGLRRLRRRPRPAAAALQLEDLVNAVTYLTTREDVDAGASARSARAARAAATPCCSARSTTAVRAVVSQVPVADGRTGCAACAASTSGSSSSTAWRPTGGPGC